MTKRISLTLSEEFCEKYPRVRIYNHQKVLLPLLEFAEFYDITTVIANGKPLDYSTLKEVYNKLSEKMGKNETKTDVQYTSIEELARMEKEELEKQNKQIKNSTQQTTVKENIEGFEEDFTQTPEDKKIKL